MLFYILLLSKFKNNINISSDLTGWQPARITHCFYEKLNVSYL